ncbi:hypothetical protein ABIB85_007653 [Bradyrhizobium sp. JR1.5]
MRRARECNGVPAVWGPVSITGLNFIEPVCDR